MILKGILRYNNSFHSSSFVCFICFFKLITSTCLNISFFVALFFFLYYLIICIKYLGEFVPIDFPIIKFPEPAYFWQTETKDKTSMQKELIRFLNMSDINLNRCRLATLHLTSHQMIKLIFFFLPCLSKRYYLFEDYLGRDSLSQFRENISSKSMGHTVVVG